MIHRKVLKVYKERTKVRDVEWTDGFLIRLDQHSSISWAPEEPTKFQGRDQGSPASSDENVIWQILKWTNKTQHLLTTVS